MLVSKMISTVQNLFGDTSEAQITPAEIIDWLNEGQRRIARDTGWISERAETDVIAGQRGYELPPDIITMERLELDGAKLPRTTLQMIDNEEPIHTTKEGAPTKYYIWGNTLYLYPTPTESGSGNLDMWYKKMPVLIQSDADSAELPESMHDAMVRFALGRAKEKDEETSDAQVIMQGVQADIGQNIHETEQKSDETYPVVTPAIDDEGMWYS
jgi:hypothetical protein